MSNGIQRGLTAGVMSLTAATGAWAQTNGNLNPGALPSSWDPPTTYAAARIPSATTTGIRPARRTAS